jgi:hypothetical protein
MEKTHIYQNTSAIDNINEALKDSESSALKFHAEHNQPIIYRDNQNRLVEEYPDGQIVIVIDYTKTV